MRIAIVDDHSIVRDMLSFFCARSLGHSVVGTAENGQQAVGLVSQTQPDVILLDVHLPDMTGFAVIETLRRAGCSSKLLLLSGYCDDHTVFLVERAHVQGFLDKLSTSASILRAAFAALAQGRTYFSEAFCREQSERHADPHAFDKLLSERERRILLLIGGLMHDEEISEALGISRNTVEKHRFNIRHKLGLDSQAKLMRFIRDHGFMSDAVADRALAERTLSER